MAGRIVLNSNNLWLFAWSNRTISVLDPGRDLNIHNVPNTIGECRQVGRVGSSNSNSTHRELEVGGVVFSGRKLVDLSTEIINHQILVNREGFMIMYFNVGAPHMYLLYPVGRPSKSLIRRLNDLFDWSKYGVQVQIPLQTVWDRFQLGTGTLMVDNRESEIGKENQRLKEQLDRQIDQKHNDDDLINQLKKEMAGLKLNSADELRKLRDEVAIKDRQIHSLRAAMQAFMTPTIN